MEINNGDSYKSIISLWIPEIISSAILVALPLLIDAYVVASLKSVTKFGALGMATGVLVMLTKLTEALPVASIAFIGHFNGRGDFPKCGEYFYNTFWITFILGILQFIFILIGAGSIFIWLGVSEKMIKVGVPFLQLKSFAVLLTFSAMVMMGFMRAVKNTYIPMVLNIVGIGFFVFFDYTLVLGKFGFPCYKLLGSAFATLIQYGMINLLAIAYIISNQNYRKYFPSFTKHLFDMSKIYQIICMSLPIIVDKSTMSISYIWLSKMIASMGAVSIVTFNTCRSLTMGALIPVLAAAQIITFLVSNKLGEGDIDGAVANIKKVLKITLISFIPILIILSTNIRFLVNLFDPKNQFTDFAAITIPFVNLLVIFDVVQVVLAGALRGAGDVKTVMWTRVWVCALFFIPISWLFKTMVIQSDAVKFVLIFGSFFVSTAMIATVFIMRLKGNFWKALLIKRG
jgi:putative MATE family efflux protein